MNILARKLFLLALGIAAFTFCMLAPMRAQTMTVKRSWSIQNNGLGARFTSGESINIEPGAKSIYAPDAIWVFQTGSLMYTVTGGQLDAFLRQVNQ